MLTSWHLKICGALNCERSEAISVAKSEIRNPEYETNSNIEIKILNILIFFGIIIYLVNYAIGWLLHFKIISMSKKTHQIFFASIIINLLLILFFIKFLSLNFFVCIASLSMMIILPFGRKGGKYHILISSAGLLLYIVFSFFTYGN